MNQEEEIPFERLGIPKALRELVIPSAPLDDRLAIAEGQLTSQPSELLGCAYLLAQDPAPEVRAAAAATLREMPEHVLAPLITQSSPTKLLEFLAVLRRDAPLMDARILTIRNANDRTCIMIAERADAELAERLCYNRERLLMTPRVYVALHGNPACREEHLQKASAFLRMNKILPAVPAQRGATVDVPVDLDAEVEAALTGAESPALRQRTQATLELFDLEADDEDGDLFHGFDFEFTDDLSSFSWELTEDGEGLSDEEEMKLEKKIEAMSVGQKVRLAHVGNKTVRSLLLRDRNKQVSMAVVKSGRLSDGEVKSLAGNRNVDDEVLREIATNREFLRKYPVKVALVNNSKCPPSVGVRLVGVLQKKDLQDLTRNRNVSAVVRQTAIRLFKQKYRSEGQKKK
jgi:hypothetical protein